MAIDAQRLKNRQFDDVVQTYTQRDAMLYALGVGVGADPIDPKELRFVYEQNLCALPTMATTLGRPDFWLADSDVGINWRRVVHSEHSLVIHSPLPPEGTLIGRTRIEEVTDRGHGKGALLRVRRDLFTAAGELQSTQIMSNLARDDGGFGGTPPTKEAHAEYPPQEPDYVVDRQTIPQAGLIYRLSGDYNPLHADPVAAERAGFTRPILHGLCSYAVAGLSVLQSCADGDSTRLSGLDVRFTSPVFPGETIRTEIWKAGVGAIFRSSIVERGITVLDVPCDIFCLVEGDKL